MFQEIELSKIVPNPFNPRKRFSGPEFDGLADSIREKGVIQPILVRPINNGDKGPSHEIVAGERRYRASMAAQRTDIPCVIREIDDDTAFEMLMIENLQREDLTGLEEAQGFKGYLDKRGAEAIDVLADKVKCSPAYIRRRLAVLALPKYALKEWECGKLRFGHLELLSRVGKPEIRGMVQEILRDNMSVGGLKRKIERHAPQLKKACFDLKTSGCLACDKNTDVQKKLFELDGAKTTCLDPACFKQKVNNYLLSKKAKRRLAAWGTTGFRFWEDVGYDSNTFHNKPPASCKGCEHLTTIVDEYGNRRGHAHTICLGEYDCFKKARLRRDASVTTTSNPGESRKRRKQQRSMDFRRDFIREEIPRRLAPDNELTRKLSLTALIMSSYKARDDFADNHGIPTEVRYGHGGDDIFLSKILALDPDKVLAEMERLAVETLPSFDHSVLLKAADLAGINLKSDFPISEDYLKKMTKPELVDLGQELRFDSLCFWETEKVASFIFEVLGRKHNTKPESLKKDELIKCFTESGIDLKGKVPAEIYEVNTTNEEGLQCKSIQ